MTANEAIEIIKYASAFNSDNSPLTKALDMAITALEEIQQYREIGTVEELQDVIKLCESLEAACKMADVLVEEIQQYRAIGTIDECRSAVERMKEEK